MFRRENSRLLTLGALLIAAILLLTVGARSGVLRPLLSIVMAPLSPVTRLVTGGTNAAVDLSKPQEDYAALQQHALELEKSIAQLQVEIVRLREIEQDYYRLSALVDYSAQHPDQNLVTGDVIAQDTSGYLRWVIINRGARDGIQVGNPVISDLGLVGRVEKVAANAAWIRLEIDQASAINAILQTSRAEGTIVGQLQGGLRMEYIPQQAQVEAGDLVLTSGLGGDFPADIVIGQVTSIRRQQAALFQEAEIRPTVDFSALKIVSVITSFNPVDISVFQQATPGAP
jgi:rod shape-determining protein MreC